MPKKQFDRQPENLLPSLKEIEFVCPLCRGRLSVIANGYECSSCRKSYLLYHGIPDFRVFPDSFLSYREDYERTDIVIAALEKFNLEELLEHYWSFSDITPAALRPKFVRSALLGEHRAHRTLEILERHDIDSTKKVLEIGAGTGDFLAAAAGTFKQVIGIDIAMRWLHVSRRRFMDKGLPVPPLVCCCAEFLPFADNTFDSIVSTSTFEFVKDQSKVLAECTRTLTENGVLYLNSANRFSLGKDPYSYLFGVGFLPRDWQARYVYRRRGASYENIKTFSYREMKMLLEKFFVIKEVSLPEIPDLALNKFNSAMRLQIRAYQLLKKNPLSSFLLRWIGPGWNVVAHKKSLR